MVGEAYASVMAMRTPLPVCLPAPYAARSCLPVYPLTAYGIFVPYASGSVLATFEPWYVEKVPALRNTVSGGGSRSLWLARCGALSRPVTVRTASFRLSGTEAVAAGAR